MEKNRFFFSVFSQKSTNQIQHLNSKFLPLQAQWHPAAIYFSIFSKHAACSIFISCFGVLAYWFFFAIISRRSFEAIPSTRMLNKQKMMRRTEKPKKKHMKIRIIDACTVNKWHILNAQYMHVDAKRQCIGENKILAVYFWMILTKPFP